MGNLLWFYEVFMVGAWQFWSFVQVVLVTITGMIVWDALDARMAEAKADSIGLDTALSWGLAFKTFTLCMIVAMAMGIAGISMGDIANDAI